MNLRLRNKGRVYAINEPASIEVLDSAGALIAVVIQKNADNVQILTPGDVRFEMYAASVRTPVSVAAILHDPVPGSGMLLDRQL